MGFEDAYAGNEFIYAPLHEKGDAMEPESVIVFDWQGNAVKEMRTGQRLARFVWTRRIMSFMHWHRMKKTAISWYVFAVIK